MLQRLNTLVLVSLVCSATCLLRQTIAADLDVTALQQQIYDTVEKTAPAIVEISRRGSIFSGVIVSPQGHVLTAGHTITPDQQYTVVLPDGRRLRGRSLGSCEQMRGERIDAGLIKIENENDLPFAKIGSSANLQLHQPCISISYPGGQRKSREPVVRFGYINTPFRNGAMIQSSALMEPGDSGGPLFDIDGKVIGIHSRIFAEAHQNFDIPIDLFKVYWDQLNVPAVFHVQDGKQLPKLGFYGEDLPDRQGIRILDLADGGIAQELGIRPEDTLTRIQETTVARLQDLQAALSSLVEEKPPTVKVTVQRGDQRLDFQFSSSRLICPQAERIEGLDEIAAARPASFPILPSLSKVFAKQESIWDDDCCTISCTTNGKASSLMGIFIADSSYVVSKSSLLGNEPVLVSDGKKIQLEVVARDDSNDLVLLRSAEPNRTGISLTKLSSADNLKRGQILLSPDPNGDGYLSVVGSSPFSSARQVSRGYLGVELRDHDQGGVVLIKVDDGAARKAGLKPGDVILQINEQIIRNRPEILRFLGSVDPQTSIKAKVRRETAEFETQITLGAPPADSGHAADLMSKSLRRDGFTSVISHDAVIMPEFCGGPVLGLDGSFIGMNAARHSRVRTFIVPASLIRDFVKEHDTAR